MVILTKHNLAKAVRVSKMSRAKGVKMGGAMYLFGQGMRGGAIVPFGGAISLYGGSFLSKLKSLGSKASTTLLGVSPAQAKRAILNKAKATAKKIVPKAAAAIQARAQALLPEVINKAAAPLMKKLPASLQGPLAQAKQLAEQTGLEVLDKGIQAGRKKIGFGNRSYGIDLTKQQQKFLEKEGALDKANQASGNAGKRIVLDSSSISILDSITAEKRFNAGKRAQLAKQLKGSGVGYL